MRASEEPQAVPEGALTHLLAQQVHDVSSFVVYERTILARRAYPIRKHERLIFTSRPHFLIVRAIRLDLTHVCRASEAVFDIRRRHKRRDSFVKPEVVPVAAGHHVAPPLMRKLV